jgi:hypothetical protein
MNTPVKAKQVELTLKQKKDVLEKVEKGVPYRQIQQEFKCSLGSITKIKNNKRVIEEAIEENQPSCKRRLNLRRTANYDINVLMWKWFNEVRSRNIPVSGVIIRQKALKYADSLGIENFQGSDGWLTRFKERHNIKFKQICGESRSVDVDVVKNWKENLDAVCQGYEDENIFNADETGLFWRALPNKTLAIAGEDVHGLKTSKERITVLFTASRTGEKLKPLVIAKSANPRCFKNIKKEKLPVTYRSNANAWMVSRFFEEYLNDLNKQMTRENRKILLFVDNASPHSHLEFSNVKIVFYPANCTSEIQPMDQGIIKSFKVFYKHDLVNQIIDEIDNPTSKKMSILDCIYWTDAAWKKVTTETIKNCFSKAGHKRHGNIVDATIDEVVTNNYTSLSHLLESRQLCSIIDSDFMDEGLPSYATFSDNNWEEELIENYIGEIKDLENEDEDEDAEIIEDQPRKIKTKSEIRSYIEEIEYFILEKDSSILDTFKLFKSDFLSKNTEEKRQTTIDSFFN